MTRRSPDPGRDPDRPVEVDIDIHVAQPARMVDYVSGGESNFAADREAIDGMAAAFPSGLDTIRAWEAVAEAFQERVVRYLAGEAGIRQFLVLDVRVPGPNSVHQIAQRIAAESRAVYLVSDPVVLAHAHELRTTTPEGATAYVPGRLDDPGKLLDDAASTLDFEQPVAVMLFGVLTLVTDDVAQQLVESLVEGVPSGSYLAISLMSSDLHPGELAEAARRHDQLVEQHKMSALVFRDRAAVTSLLDGLELVEPGVVPMAEWSREGGPASLEGLFVPAYTAVGCKFRPGPSQMCDGGKQP